MPRPICNCINNSDYCDVCEKWDALFNSASQLVQEMDRTWEHIGQVTRNKYAVRCHEAIMQIKVS